MRKIPLTKGKVALVDNADYDWLNRRKWCAVQVRNNYYAVRGIHLARDKRRLQQMHRLVLGLQRGDSRQTDHIDGDGLNNQRSNLRICTVIQNQQSSRKQKGCTSIYKGVHWHCGTHKWQSRIQVKGKRMHLGSFDSETDAAATYNETALKHFGEFALLNTL